MAEDAAAVGTGPGEIRRKPAADTAEEKGALDAHELQDLRHLGIEPEQIAHVALAIIAAKAAGDIHAAAEIAQQRFARDEKDIGHRVPGAELKPALGRKRPHSWFILRPRLDIILQRHGLAVEMKDADGGVLLKQIQRRIESFDKAIAEGLLAQPPFPVPMRA